jgi:hypothetical protein
LFDSRFEDYKFKQVFESVNGTGRRRGQRERGRKEPVPRRVKNAKARKTPPTQENNKAEAKQVEYSR